MDLKLRVNFEVVLVLQYQAAGYCRPVLVNQYSSFQNGNLSNSHLIISADIIHPICKLFNALFRILDTPSLFSYNVFVYNPLA
jgi:hypothetical protein